MSIGVEFVVVNVENDDEKPIILGPSFFVVGQALLNVQGKELNLVINREKLKFDVGQAMKQPLERK